jgi:hypothetical protein
LEQPDHVRHVQRGGRVAGAHHVGEVHDDEVLAVAAPGGRVGAALAAEAPCAALQNGVHLADIERVADDQPPHVLVPPAQVPAQAFYLVAGALLGQEGVGLVRHGLQIDVHGAVIGLRQIAQPAFNGHGGPSGCPAQSAC